MAKLAVKEATVLTMTFETVIPAPPTSTFVPPATKPVPASATATVFPRTPEDGLTDVSVGAGAGVGDGVGDGPGPGAGPGDGVGPGVGVGAGEGDGVGPGAGAGVGEGAGGAGVGLGAGAGGGVGVGCGEGLGGGSVGGGSVSGVVSGEPHPADRRLTVMSAAAILPTCMDTCRLRRFVDRADSVYRHELLNALPVLDLARVHVPFRIRRDRVNPVQLPRVAAVAAE